MKRELGIARCGLACCLCSENKECKGCRQDGFADLSWCKDAEWCQNRKCVLEKNISGCYECQPKDCRKGLFADKIKARAFAEFARRYGVSELLDCLERNERAGVVYHRQGIMGDYDDFDDLEELIGFIRKGERQTVGFEHFDPTDEKRSCVVRTMTKLTGRDYGSVKAELAALAAEMGCETYNDQRVFGRFLEDLGFSRIGGYEGLTVGELELKNGSWCVHCTDRKEFQHLLPVVDGVIFDRRDDSRGLFVEAVYKKTTN